MERNTSGKEGRRERKNSVGKTSAFKGLKMPVGPIDPRWWE